MMMWMVDFAEMTTAEVVAYVADLEARPEADAERAQVLDDARHELLKRERRRAIEAGLTRQ